MSISPRRCGRAIKRLGRLLTGQDVLYKYDIRLKKATLGTVYGGWTIAPEYVDSGREMYSFGIGTDISFDQEIIRLFGLHVHGFDPSPHVISWIAMQKLPSAFTFHPYGLAELDGALPFFSPKKSGGMYSMQSQHSFVSDVQEQLPVRSLESIIESLSTPQIEILKIDIEGAEYPLLPSIIHCQVPIKQLLIEFHHRIGAASLQTTVNSVNELRKSGFFLFHVSETSSEFSFIHRDFIR
jgi:FkbM family methyltransferase